jgi:hypothetical protein
MPQSELYVACDVDQIPMSNAKWSERPSVNGVEQVKELFALINQRRLDGVILATNFTFRRVQPSKERAHPRYEFWGETDGTHEVPEEISRDEVKQRISMMFNLTGHLRINDQ